MGSFSDSFPQSNYEYAAQNIVGTYSYGNTESSTTISVGSLGTVSQMFQVDSRHKIVELYRHNAYKQSIQV
jgi:hypothetical protein